MTPADLHAAIVAGVQERLALAQAATRGPWNVRYDDPNDSAELVALDGHPVAVVTWCDEHPRMARPNFAHMAANDPAFVIRMCTAALKRLEEHAPVLDEEAVAGCGVCKEESPCHVERDEADVWEVDPDG